VGRHGSFCLTALIPLHSKDTLSPQYRHAGFRCVPGAFPSIVGCRLPEQVGNEISPGCRTTGNDRKEGGRGKRDVMVRRIARIPEHDQIRVPTYQPGLMVSTANFKSKFPGRPLRAASMVL
jgi:hypothetical protein